MPQNIALHFDGTWNEPSAKRDPEESTDTNVRRFFESVRPASAGGDPQVAWYNKGVGTEWMNKVRGGAFGMGLDDHICEGYSKLCELYQPGDRVYLIGFSRGAYTARSLVGFIRNAGLLRSANEKSVRDAYEFYREKDKGADSRLAKEFREQNSTEIQIHFVGVWDTVGALGIPLRFFKGLNADKYGFHDTQLSRIVRNAFHALALDEHREPYAATLWGKRPVADLGQRLEQVWFAGAHADVGGGYAGQPLANPPLRWMQRRAIECGLAVDVLPDAPDAEARQREHLAPAHDSYSEFMGGAFAKISQRHYRMLGRKEDGDQALHESLLTRLDEIGNFTPINSGLAALLMKRIVAKD